MNVRQITFYEKKKYLNEINPLIRLRLSVRKKLLEIFIWRIK